VTRKHAFMVCALVATNQYAVVHAAPDVHAAERDAREADAQPRADGDHVEKRVAAFATVAFGLPGPDFVNELAGARFELGYTPRFTLGMGLAYVNLKGKDGRVSNALPEALVGYRFPLGKSIGVPIRFAGGYLPMNGPTLRLSAGIDLRLSDAVACELDLVEPMVWVARDRPEYSLNLGAGVRATF
jgi:hypothetical protein